MAARKTALKEKRVGSAEDKTFYRIFAAFLIAAVTEIVLVILYRGYFYNQLTAVHTKLIKTIFWIFAVFCLLCIILAIFLQIKKKKAAGYFIAAAVLLACFAIACRLMIGYEMIAAKMLCVACPVILVLYASYIIYQREFFLIGLLCTVCFYVLWTEKAYFFLNRNYLNIALAGMVVFDAIIAAVALLSRSNDGKLSVFGKSIRIYEMRKGFALILLTCALTFAAALLSGFFGDLVGEISIFVIAAYVFVSAVYHTVKLM